MIAKEKEKLFRELHKMQEAHTKEIEKNFEKMNLKPKIPYEKCCKVAHVHDNALDVGIFDDSGMRYLDDTNDDHVGLYGNYTKKTIMEPPVKLNAPVESGKAMRMSKRY